MDTFLRFTGIIVGMFLLLRMGIATAYCEDSQLPFSTDIKAEQLPKTALVETDKGSFEIRFYRRQAPISVRNFEYLARKHFYDSLKFHRYEPGFVIQGGDPTGSGKGGPGYTLPPEFSDLHHLEGTVAFARLPSPVNPERRSNGSQFYICLNSAPHLDGLYTIFARVTHGMDIVERLRKGDKILAIKFPKR